MKNNHSKSLYTIGSLRKSINLFKKYYVSYLDFIYVLANCSIPIQISSNRNLRNINDVKGNKYLKELKLHADRFAMNQEFKDSFSMFNFANNSVLILMLFSLCTLIFSYSINHSLVNFNYRVLLSVGCIVFSLFLYKKCKEHYCYLLFSCIIHPNKLKFKFVRLLSCTLFKISCFGTVIVSLITILDFKFL